MSGPVQYSDAAAPQTQPAGASVRVCQRCKVMSRVDVRFCGLCGAPAAFTMETAITDTPERTVSHTLLGEEQVQDRHEIRAGRSIAITDRGVRHRRNEDAVALRTLKPTSQDATEATLCVVCDGVSSTSRAHEASTVAAEVGIAALAVALEDGTDPTDATRQAFHRAAAAVAHLADPTPATSDVPSCTYISVVVMGGTVTVGWVGDSRAYWLPDADRHRAIMLTEDDSWLTAVLAAGDLDPLQAAADHRAHAITGWLGGNSPNPHPHCTTVCPGEPGVVLVCTDGLWRYMASPLEMSAAVPASPTEDALVVAQELVRQALRAGGRDNTTVALLPVGNNADDNAKEEP